MYFPNISHIGVIQSLTQRCKNQQESNFTCILFIYLSFPGNVISISKITYYINISDLSVIVQIWTS